MKRQLAILAAAVGLAASAFAATIDLSTVTSKVSGSFIGLDGKKRTMKAVTVTGIDGTSAATVALDVKGLGRMTAVIGGSQFAGALGSWHVQSANVGGDWMKAHATAVVTVGTALWWMASVTARRRARTPSCPGRSRSSRRKTIEHEAPFVRLFGIICAMPRHATGGTSRIFLSPPWTGEPERAAMRRAFASGYIAPCGPMVDEFDRRLGALAGQHAAAVASGTAALDLLMAELGVGPGDRVVASSLTFVATVGPAVHRGATPVFVDSDPATGLISIPLLRRALRAARPKCVIAADLYGQCCDYDALEALCAEHGVPLVVDAAEAVGATSNGRPAGHAGLAAVYSFNGNKIITTSGGGAVLSRDPEIVARARWRAQQAREPVPWYEHREIGFNYRMSNLLGALGCAQLDRLPAIIRRKRRIFAFYEKAFAARPELGAVPFPCAAPKESTRWLSVFLFPAQATRDAVAARLAAANIESRPVWKPLHLQPAFRKCRVYGGAVVEDLFNRGLCLPSGAGLARKDLARIEACL